VLAIGDTGDRGLRAESRGQPESVITNLREPA